jgi:hypothetical protein
MSEKNFEPFMKMQDIEEAAKRQDEIAKRQAAAKRQGVAKRQDEAKCQ